MTQSGHLYADLSHYYDLFCAGVDYGEQCEFAHRVFRSFSGQAPAQNSRPAAQPRYLDLACGTGPHIAHMLAYGYQCSGLDNSADMLRMAQARCPRAQLIHADMAALALDNCVELVSCFLYSIHYNHPLSALYQTLARVWQALVPGGVFVFNMVDVRGINSRHVVSTELEHQGHQLRFKSGWTYCGQGDAMALHLMVEDSYQGQTRQWQDVHTMSAITVDEMQHWLQYCGFEVTVLEHDYRSLQVFGGDSFNVLVVAVKPVSG